MKIRYEACNFRGEALAQIEQAKQIVDQFTKDGYSLTLRQLYYQFVARGWLENTERNYKNLGTLIGKARLAGMLDWTALEDRTRFLRRLDHWDSPAEIVDAARRSYRRNLWEGQPNYVEVWVEKDALVDVVARAADSLDTPYFSCRGYVSLSEMWVAAQRMIQQARMGKLCVILHLGDHDPSGVDMSRDIAQRLKTFRASVAVTRIALTMDQIEELDPPPNPAKLTDSRCEDYIRQYGNESWELDSLDPRYINDLIDKHVRKFIVPGIWAIAERHQEKERELLAEATKSIQRWLKEQEDL